MKRTRKTKGRKRPSKGTLPDSHDRTSKAADQICELTNAFCQEHLNEEYRELCEDMIATLLDIDFPLEKGRPAGWASGIVHAVGWVNFLQDPNQQPHMTSVQVAAGFGVSQQTMTAKSKIIRDDLDLIQLDPDWCLPAKLKDNPLVWTIDVNGFLMDARYAPRQVQEEAYRLGLIPYIPADEQERRAEADAGPEVIQFPSGKNNASGPTGSEQRKNEGPPLSEGSEE
jgi:hypothetical protein